MLVKISEEKSRADAEIETLKSNLEMCEREIKSLKYEVHVVSKELEIRNEEKNMCIRSAESANKQHLEGVKKIAKLEAECQRLRSLVRKKLPGPAALAQMKLEVENLGRDSARQKRSPVKASSPCKSPGGYSSTGSEFSLDNSHKFQKENEFLTERLLAMEEETKMLKEALAKRNSELLESRNLCAQSASKLQSLEAQVQQINSQKSSLEVCPNLNTSNPSSSISVSEDGNDDSGSCSESFSTSQSQQTKKEKEMAALERVESINSHVELIDDFLEMEKLACLPNQSSSNGSMDSKDSSGDQKSELVILDAHTELEESHRGSPAVMELRSRLSKVLESVSTDADLQKIVGDIKCILQDMNDCMEQDKPSEVSDLCPEQNQVEDCHLAEQKLQSIHQDLKNAVSQIHDFVLLLRNEVRAGQDTDIEGNDLVELIEGFSITSNHVLSGDKHLDDFVLGLANVFNEAMELKVCFASSEVETLSPDCIDKVALPESKVVVKDSSQEIYQNGVSTTSQEFRVMKTEFWGMNQTPNYRK